MRPVIVSMVERRNICKIDDVQYKLGLRELQLKLQFEPMIISFANSLHSIYFTHSSSVHCKSQETRLI